MTDPLQPLPETVEALRELTRHGDRAVAQTLLELSRNVQAIVPEIVGMSLSIVAESLTFTMTATSGPVAELDAMQYLTSGPCERTLATGEVNQFHADDPADERTWELFARASAAAGVESTLSLPILREGVVVAGINLYAATATAFDDKHEQLAQACGGWVGGTVSNADLEFTTRFEAAETPSRLRAQRLVDQAVGVLMSRLELTMEEAEDVLRESAQRAGITDAQLARVLIDILGPPH